MKILIIITHSTLVLFMYFSRPLTMFFFIGKLAYCLIQETYRFNKPSFFTVRLSVARSFERGQFIKKWEQVLWPTNCRTSTARLLSRSEVKRITYRIWSGMIKLEGHRNVVKRRMSHCRSDWVGARCTTIDTTRSKKKQLQLRRWKFFEECYKDPKLPVRLKISNYFQNWSKIQASGTSRDNQYYIYCHLDDQISVSCLLKRKGNKTD